MISRIYILLWFRKNICVNWLFSEFFICMFCFFLHSEYTLLIAFLYNMCVCVCVCMCDLLVSEIAIIQII